MKLRGKDIDIIKEGGAFLDSLHPKPSPQLQSHVTRYQSTLELEASAIGLLKLVDESVGQDVTSPTEADLLVSDTGQTVLHLSASLGFAQLLQRLIMCGVNLDQQDFNGYTAIHFAALHGHTGCVRSLVSGGADPGIMDEHGHTALEIALKFDNRAIAELLETCRKADPYVGDSGSQRKNGTGIAPRVALVLETPQPSSSRPLLRVNAIGYFLARTTHLPLLMALSFSFRCTCRK